jgi:cytoskeletal protein CcmA (bactofilin family)
MWNKKTEEESSPKAAAPRPVVATPPPAPVQPAPAPVAANQPQVKAPSSGGTLGSTMTVKGEIYSREELFVDGEIQGSIELQHRLTVGPNGKVRAKVKAKEVVVHGSIHGDVQSTEKIIIREKGSLVGDITTAGIVIEDGAYFKGSIDIVRADANKKPSSEPVPAPAGEKPSDQGRRTDATPRPSVEKSVEATGTEVHATAGRHA